MVFDQFTWTNVLLTLGLAILVLILVCRPSRSRYPPGVSGFPFVGVLPYLFGSTPEKKYKEWSLEKYGPVMSVKLMGHDLIVLSTYDVITQAFEKLGTSTSGRFDTFLFGQIQGDNGITYIDYDQYFENQKTFGKKFIQSYGTHGLEHVINEEINFFLKSLATKTNRPVDIEPEMYGLVCNVIHMLVFKKRYDYEELIAAPSYEGVEDIFGNHCKDAKTLFLIELKPWIRRFPPFRSSNNRLIARAKPVLEWIHSHVEEIRENPEAYDESCFVKNFLQEQKKNSKDYNDEQLTAYLREWLGAIKNAYTALRWSVLCALRHPNYYSQVVNEINKIWGKDLPSAQKSSETPLTWAFIEEVLRICSPLPKTLEHKALKEFTLGEFVIPKDSELFGNLWGANHDPVTWPEPEKFNPFRHIQKDGSLISPTKVIQFSVGPRTCLGKPLAKSMLYLSLTRLFQNFDISAPVGVSLPTLDEGYNGVTFDSLSFEVVLKKKEM